MSDLIGPSSWKNCFCLFPEASDLLLDPLNTHNWTSLNCYFVRVINMFLLLCMCFPGGLKPFLAAKLMPSQKKEMNNKKVKRAFFPLGVCFPSFPVIKAPISLDKLWALTKMWQTSWNSISIQPSVDPLLSHVNMANYCKPLVSYAPACYQLAKEVFLDPNSKEPVSHSLKPDDCVVRNIIRGRHRQGPLKVASPRGPNQGHHCKRKRR